MRPILCLVLWQLCCLWSCQVVRSQTDHFKFTIVHANDLYSAFAGVTSDHSPCDSNTHSNECIGGAPKIVNQVRELRSKGFVLFVNAGNNLGGFWYNRFGSQVVSDFFSRDFLDFDVITLGLSDLDLETIPQQNVTQFLYDLSLASRVVSCNVDSKYITNFYSSVRRSTRMPLGAQGKLGVIGFVGSTGPTNIDSERRRTNEFVNIDDPIKCLKEEAEEMRRANVDVIVAIGSGTQELFKQIANTVPLIDVVIGSYGTSKNLSLLTPRTSQTYPDHIIEGPTGQTIVATADVLGQSIGLLTVTIDKRGNIISNNGTLLRLDDTVNSDESTLIKVNEYQNKLVIGTTNVYLQGSDCGQRECTLGNLIADAMLFYRMHYINQTFVNSMASKRGTDVFGQKVDDKRDVIALFNSEMIGESVGEPEINPDRQYFITQISLDKVFKRGNPKIQMFILSGKTVRQILEDQIQRRDLVQVSGLKVDYDLSRDPNDRITAIAVKCTVGLCPDHRFSPFNDSKLYEVLLPQSIAVEETDGDVRVAHDLSTVDVLQHYIKHNSPINATIEDRITLRNGNVLNGKCDAFGAKTWILTTLLSALIAVCHLRRYN